VGEHSIGFFQFATVGRPIRPGLIILVSCHQLINSSWLASNYSQGRLSAIHERQWKPNRVMSRRIVPRPDASNQQCLD
jgi:hypothetical protein